jgi:hypothetical protein
VDGLEDTAKGANMKKPKPYREYTPLKHILRDGWCRGFQLKQTIDEAIAMGHVHIKADDVLAAWKEFDIEFGEYLFSDKPDADCTDFAHPAWWRGHHDAVMQHCIHVERILDGKDRGGICSPPWEPVRRRLFALVEASGKFPALEVALREIQEGSRTQGAHTGMCWSDADKIATKALESSPAGIDMILFCPNCGLQHVDEVEEVHGMDDGFPISATVWSNPPHRSHLCKKQDGGCGHIWRPADVATNGVKELKTKGKADGPVVNPMRDADVKMLAWLEKHKWGFALEPTPQLYKRAMWSITINGRPDQTVHESISAAMKETT